MSQLPAIGGLYVLDDDTMQARRATFDELPAKARAASFGYELLLRKPTQDFFALIARGDSCLRSAGIKPQWVRMPPKSSRRPGGRNSHDGRREHARVRREANHRERA